MHHLTVLHVYSLATLHSEGIILFTFPINTFSNRCLTMTHVPKNPTSPPQKRKNPSSQRSTSTQPRPGLLGAARTLVMEDQLSILTICILMKRDHPCSSVDICIQETMLLLLLELVGSTRVVPNHMQTVLSMIALWYKYCCPILEMFPRQSFACA